MENHVLRRTSRTRTHTTIRVISMHQSRKVFLKTRITVAQLLIESVGIVSDCYPGSQRLAHQLTVLLTHVDIVWVDARYHQETPDNRSLWGQFIKCSRDGGSPMLTAQWHGVQATTRHRERPHTIRLHWELNQVFAIIDDATLFVE